jgi:hypothetical protein
MLQQALCQFGLRNEVVRIRGGPSEKKHVVVRSALAAVVVGMVAGGARSTITNLDLLAETISAIVLIHSAPST